MELYSMQPCESGLFTQHNAFLIKQSLMMYEMLLYNFALVFFCLFQNVLISSPTLVSDKQNVFWLRNDYSYSFKYQRRTKQISSINAQEKVKQKKQISSLTHTLFGQPLPCLLLIEIHLLGKFATDCDLCQLEKEREQLLP